MKQKNVRKYLLTAVALGAVTLGSTASVSAAPGDYIWTFESSANPDGSRSLDFDEFRVTLPASWNGKCRITTTRGSVSFYHIESRERYSARYGTPCGGHLFTIAVGTKEACQECPNGEAIGDGIQGFYFFEYPSDVQGYYEDGNVMNEFSMLSSSIDQITSSLVLKSIDPVDGFVYQNDSAVHPEAALGSEDHPEAAPDGMSAQTSDSAEYIIPQSSDVCLTDYDLQYMSSEDLQMAINEIYARHHRRFSLPEIQAYFDGLSWYEGTTNPEQFDVNVLSELEMANIDLMAAHMNGAVG